VAQPFEKTLATIVERKTQHQTLKKKRKVGKSIEIGDVQQFAKMEGSNSGMKPRGEYRGHKIWKLNLSKARSKRVEVSRKKTEGLFWKGQVKLDEIEGGGRTGKPRNRASIKV